MAARARPRRPDGDAGHHGPVRGDHRQPEDEAEGRLRHRELPLAPSASTCFSKQNAWILKTIFGPTKADVVGKRITISAVPDTSGFTEHGIRILFTGSPDVDGDRKLTLPGGRSLTFKKTAAKHAKAEEGVDAVTGEVEEGQGGQETAISGDAGGSGMTRPKAPMAANTATSEDRGLLRQRV